MANNITIRKRTSAEDVRNEILRALQRHAGLEAANVNISVVNGTVTLDGKVDTYLDIDRIEDAAWAAPGVTKVIDKLRVA